MFSCCSPTEANFDQHPADTGFNSALTICTENAERETLMKFLSIYEGKSYIFSQNLNDHFSQFYWLVSTEFLYLSSETNEKIYMQQKSSYFFLPT